MRRILLAAMLLSSPAFAQNYVGPMQVQNGLSEIYRGGPTARSQARSNLGLGTAATHDAGDFDAAGVAASLLAPYLTAATAASTYAPLASPAGTTAPQNYVFVKPNLTPDQALKFGQQKLVELTRHERIVRVEMPGELVLTTRGMVSLTGTGTSWDQQYYVAELTREIGEHGFYQRLRLKNSSPRTQQTVL